METETTNSFLERSPKLANHIMTFYAVDIESFRPSLKNTGVNVILMSRIREGEAKRQCFHRLALSMIRIDESLKAIYDVFP
jgi:hypothetical protein